MKFLALSLAALALFATPAHGTDEPDRSGGPYVPTPPAVVEAMLKLAGVAERDFVVDLGSGDGRIVLTAATKFRAGGMGVEIDPGLVELANESARKLGVAERVHFIRQDVRQADLSKATVVTLYLLPGMMSNLRAKLLAELRPGSRIVSHDFTFDLWRPDRTVTVETPEKYDVTGAWTSDVHLWIVPARIHGVWQGRWLDRPGNGFRLDLRQGFQQFDGRIAHRGHSTSVRDGRIRGADLSFAVTGGNGRTERFLATVSRGEMRGEVRDGETVLARWSATRVP